MDMLNKPFDDFYVALSECRHQDRHLSVVLTINICTITKEQLAYFQMAPLKQINIHSCINQKDFDMFLHHSVSQKQAVKIKWLLLLLPLNKNRSLKVSNKQAMYKIHVTYLHQVTIQQFCSMDYQCVYLPLSYIYLI